jgi:hypothetical protein
LNQRHFSRIYWGLFLILFSLTTCSAHVSASFDTYSGANGSNGYSIKTPNGQVQAPIRFTLENDRQTIFLHTGERFDLELSRSYTWIIYIDHPKEVGQIFNVLIANDSQGLFEALEPGTSTLTAFGTEICDPALPACDHVAITFILHIQVVE